MSHWLLVLPDKLDYLGTIPKISEWDQTLSATVDVLAAPGDHVALWRPGRGGGLIAAGRIARIGPYTDPRQALALAYHPSRAGAPKIETKMMLAYIYLDDPFLSSPLSVSYLAGLSFEDVFMSALRRSSHPDGGRQCVRLDISDSQWKELLDRVGARSSDNEWPASWNIPPGNIVDRQELQDVYGGNRHFLSSASAHTPTFFLFINDSRDGAKPSYQWDGDVLIVAGHIEREEGLSERNRALLTHYWRGRPLRVFICRKKECAYVGEFIVDQDRPIERLITVRVSTSKVHRIMLKTHERYQDGIQPLLRLRMLAGVEPGISGADLFKPETPRMTVSLRLAANGNDPEFHAGSVTITEQISRIFARPGIAEQLANADLGEDIAATLKTAARIQDLRGAVQQLRDYLVEDIKDETVFQSWCDRHSWVFGNAYVARDDIRRITEDDVIDVMMKSSLNSMRDIFELKSPKMPVLIWDSGHKDWYWASNVSKAIGQCHRYLDKLQERAALLMQDHPGLVTYHPRATVIIGRSNGWGDAQQRALHGLNARLHGITVSTYDHLLAQAETTLETLTTANR